jgi:hypothetical protein
MTHPSHGSRDLVGDDCVYRRRTPRECHARKRAQSQLRICDLNRPLLGEVVRLSRPRRWSIGDMMIVIVMSALALSLATVLWRSRLPSDECLWCGVTASLAILAHYAQWPYSNIRIDRLSCWSQLLASLIVIGLGVAALISLIVFSLVFPEGSVLLVALMVTMTVFRVTWD